MNTFRLFLAFFIIVFYMPQTYRFNPVIRQLYSMNLFLTYTEAKRFVRILTPASMLLFLFTCLLLSYLY
uniref:Uncharacterized protein n=1 Tax=Pleurastrum terricola TaxID=34116 RepID=A6YG62_PLETE|nr:hypothetical protein LeteCp007 [Pleurastrum terricola]ABO69356.1 hypothetical protein [Pleurastrum terricola]